MKVFGLSTESGDVYTEFALIALLRCCLLDDELDSFARRVRDMEKADTIKVGRIVITCYEVQTLED